MEILLRYTFVFGFGLVSLVTFKVVTTALEHQWVF
jgi:hypothetical protein